VPVLGREHRTACSGHLSQNWY